jgi:hypothetical protein
MSKARTLAGTVSDGAVLADGTVDAAEIGNLTLPTGGDIVGTTSTQTLTNKTLTDPIVSLGGTNGTSGQVLTSAGTGAAPTWAALPPSGPTVTAVASGSLSDGSTVIVNADGTVSVVAGGPSAPQLFNNAQTGFFSAAYDSVAQRVIIAYQDGFTTSFGTAVVGTVSGNSISFGSPVVFNSASTSRMSTTYDSVAQRVVIAYVNVGNSNFGTAIVGTVSGTSISFGTAVVFNSTATSQNTDGISATYDTNTQRVVIAYIDNSNFGTAIVGTVSGTSISFGTAVVFNSATTSNTAITYDSVAQRVVIAYSNGGNSSHGTARVGTVSGTSISFGTAVVFASAASSLISATYDTNTQRVVIAYLTTTGNASVGTVSGTSISFGGAGTFIYSGNASGISATYDSAAQRVVVAYTDSSSGNAFAVVGTVSGTSISFGTAVVFSTSGARSSAIYDANAQRVVIAYRPGSAATGLVVIINTPLLTTNLTTENFIGFSNAAYTNGQTATIQIVGAVDDAQSGLTPGQSYFVQNNGTLGLTAANPSVFAGTAVASNKIIVKG